VQISSIKPTGSPSSSTQLCYYRGVTWLELAPKGVFYLRVNSFLLLRLVNTFNL